MVFKSKIIYNGESKFFMIDKLVFKRFLRRVGEKFDFKKNDEILIQYIDEDMDTITVSNKQELQLAFEEAKELKTLPKFNVSLVSDQDDLEDFETDEFVGEIGELSQDDSTGSQEDVENKSSDISSEESENSSYPIVTFRQLKRKIKSITQEAVDKTSEMTIKVGDKVVCTVDLLKMHLKYGRSEGKKQLKKLKRQAKKSQKQAKRAYRNAFKTGKKLTKLEKIAIREKGIEARKEKMIARQVRLQNLQDKIKYRQANLEIKQQRIAKRKQKLEEEQQKLQTVKPDSIAKSGTVKLVVRKKGDNDNEINRLLKKRDAQYERLTSKINELKDDM